MLSDTLFRLPRYDGLHQLQRRGDRGARELTTHRLMLSAGGSASYAVPDEETVVVLQSGRGTLAAGGQSWSVSRASVFTERATALLLPAGVELTVKSDTPLEAILAIRSDILVKGADWTDNIVGSQEVEGWGGKVVALPLVEGQSTTGIIERVLHRGSSV